jgi:hypothetical protein
VTDADAAAPPPRRWLHLGVRLAVVVAVSLVLGGLTSFAQGVLPDELRPLANSASGWTILTALIVWRVGAAATGS